MEEVLFLRIKAFGGTWFFLYRPHSLYEKWYFFVSEVTQNLF